MNFIAHRRYKTYISIYPILILCAVLLLISYYAGIWYGKQAERKAVLDGLTRGEVAKMTLEPISLPASYSRLADIIYTIEGGDQTRWAYGVKQIGSRKILPHELTEQHARQICLNSLRFSRKC